MKKMKKMKNTSRFLIPFLSLAFSALLIIMYTCDLNFEIRHTSILYILLEKKMEYLVYAVMLVFHVSIFALVCPKLKKWSQGITALLLSLLLAVEVFFLNNYWMYLDVYAPWATDYYFKDFLRASVKHIWGRDTWRYLALMGITVFLCAVWSILRRRNRRKHFPRRREGMIMATPRDLNGIKRLFFGRGTYVVGKNELLSAGRYLFELDLTRRTSGSIEWYREPDDDFSPIEHTYELDENSSQCCISLRDGDMIAVSGGIIAIRITEDGKPDSVKQS